MFSYVVRNVSPSTPRDLPTQVLDFLDYSQFKENFDSVWRNLQLKVTSSNPTDGIEIANLIKNLNRQNKVMLLVGGRSLPIDNQTTTVCKITSIFERVSTSRFRRQGSFICIKQ